MKFNAQVFILPGLGNSGPDHWQTLWQEKFGFKRIDQNEWETPDRTEWVERVQQIVSDYDPSNIILVGHSLACCTIAYWSQKYRVPIRGALLVAPSDTESEVYPRGTHGFKPMPLERLGFNSIVVSSTDDIYVTPARAKKFSEAWGSRLVLLENHGHINVSAGFGPWEEGIALLQEL